MKTAALLPTPGDPLVARYWLRNYEQIWRGEVDELLVLINGNSSTADFFRSAGARVFVENHRMGHGEALDQLLKETDADRIVLVEDDAYVRFPGSIRATLDSLQPAEAIGCPRGGMDPAIYAAATEKWGEINGPNGSSGPGLWPCFLFAATSDLRRCGTMAAKSWQAGETIPGLGYTCPSSMTTDTMTAAAFVLRTLCTIRHAPQYKEQWQKTCTGPELWFHVGGLSTDIGSGRPDIGMDNLEGRDWSHRLWWLRRMGHDVAEHAQRMAVRPDYWNHRLESWITWNDQEAQ